MKMDWNIRCIWHRLLSVCKHRFFFFKRRYSKGLLRRSVTFITSSFPTVISFPSSYRTCQYVLLLRSTWQLYLLHLARTFHTLTLNVEKKGKKKKGGGRNQIPETKPTRNTLPGFCFAIKENSRTCVVISLERRVFRWEMEGGVRGTASMPNTTTLCSLSRILLERRVIVYITRSVRIGFRMNLRQLMQLLFSANLKRCKLPIFKRDYTPQSIWDFEGD